jgi:hypothetical protein
MRVSKAALIQRAPSAGRLKSIQSANCKFILVASDAERQRPQCLEGHVSVSLPYTSGRPNSFNV